MLPNNSTKNIIGTKKQQPGNQNNYKLFENKHQTSTDRGGGYHLWGKSLREDILK